MVSVTGDSSLKVVMIRFFSRLPFGHLTTRGVGLSPTTIRVLINQSIHHSSGHFVVLMEPAETASSASSEWATVMITDGRSLGIKWQTRDVLRCFCS